MESSYPIKQSEYGEAAQATQLLSQGIKPSQGLSESACVRKECYKVV